MVTPVGACKRGCRLLLKRIVCDSLDIKQKWSRLSAVRVISCHVGCTFTLSLFGFFVLLFVVFADHLVRGRFWLLRTFKRIRGGPCECFDLAFTLGLCSASSASYSCACRGVHVVCKQMNSTEIFVLLAGRHKSWWHENGNGQQRIVEHFVSHTLWQQTEELRLDDCRVIHWFGDLYSSSLRRQVYATSSTCLEMEVDFSLAVFRNVRRFFFSVCFFFLSFFFLLSFIWKLHQIGIGRLTSVA